MGKKKTQQKAAKVAPPPKPVESSEEEEDDSSEEEVVVKPTKKTPVTKKAPAKQDSSEEEEEEDSDEEEEEDDSEEETVTKAVNGKAKAEESDDDDEDDEEEEEDSDEEEETPAVKKANNVKKMEVDEDDSDDDEEEDDDDEEEDDDSDDEADEEDEAPVKGKRKAAKDSSPAAKKGKFDEDAEDCKVFVRNLPRDVTEASLTKAFKKVAEVAIPKRNDGTPKGFAFITFKTAKDAKAVLSAKEAFEVNGQEVAVDAAKKKTDAPSTPRQEGGGGSGQFEEERTRTLFVKNVGENTTSDGLKEFFNAESVTLPMDSGYHKGFAFIVLGTSAEVAKAVEEKQGAELDGSALYVDFRDKGGKTPNRREPFKREGNANSGTPGESKVLFVKNLPYETSSEELQSSFDGAISARLATDRETQRPKGFGYVEFSSPSDAKAAFDSAGDMELNGRRLFIDFAAERTGGGDRGGRGGFRGGRGGDRGGRGGRGGGFRGRGGDRGGFRGRGGRGGDRGGRGGFRGRGGFSDYKGSKKSFNDSD